MAKINFTQKEILAKFMGEHTDLAKNILPNSSQGKTKTNQLWEHLACKLNVSGPPIKDSKAWRKVYADQKQIVKRKLSFNKLSKKRTGGGPYEEKVLTQVEEQLMVAAGIDVAVEGLNTVRCFGTHKKYTTPPKENYISTETAQENSKDFGSSPYLISDNENQGFSPFTEVEFIDDENLDPSINELKPAETDIKYKDKKLPQIRKKENKSNLLKQNLQCLELYQNEMLKRLDKLIEINNKRAELKENEVAVNNEILQLKKQKLQMQKIEHEMTTQIKVTELEISRKELKKLKNPYNQGY